MLDDIPPIELLEALLLDEVLDKIPPEELLEGLLLVDVLDDAPPTGLLEDMPLMVDEVDCPRVEDEEEVGTPPELDEDVFELVVVELPTLPALDDEVLEAPDPDEAVAMS